MIIEIREIPVNVKRVILEFNDSNDVSTNIETMNSDISQKSTKTINTVKSANAETSVNSETTEATDKPIDLNFGNTTTQKQETIGQIKIPDKQRDPKVSSSLQNLKI